MLTPPAPAIGGTLECCLLHRNALPAADRRVLPKAQLVITFQEYLSICARHGQMVKIARKQLCHAAAPAVCNVCMPQHSQADFFEREQHLKSHLRLAGAYIAPSRFLRDRYVDWGLPSERFHVL